MRLLELLRRQRDLSQQELAKILGCAQSSISHWENKGKAPDLANGPARRLEEVFQRPVPELLQPVNV